jgi:cytoskeletal protein RodZ
MADINFEQLEIPEHAIPEREMHHPEFQNEDVEKPKMHRWVKSLVVILVIVILLGFGIFFAYRYLYAQSQNPSSLIGAAWVDIHTKPDSDPDQDGLSNAEEAQYASDFWKKDTDGDGFSDGEEVKHGFNPNGPGKLTDSKLDVNSLGL